MKGDFSRFGFGSGRGFSRVLVQQGRMSVDADANEQQFINLAALRAFAADLVGRHGGAGDAFKLAAVNKGGRTQLMIAPGRYYIDGWMAQNWSDAGYLDSPGEGNARVVGQPFYPAAPPLTQGSYLAYLELWERSVSAAELDRLGRPNAPDALREVGLGGPDTAARAQLVWQVRLEDAQALPKDGGGKVDLSNLDAVIEVLLPQQNGLLSAQTAQAPIESDDPCEVPPRSRYRGVENQLYRIEVAHAGKAGSATFVWSRENGAVAFPLDNVAGPKLKLADVWRDDRFTIGVSDIVEVVSDASGLGAEPEFFRVEDYQPDSATLTLSGTPAAQTGGALRPLVVRRWDHGRKRKAGDGSPKMTADNTLLIEEGKPLTIEQGITVQFDAPAAGENVYRSGDYWLIPARSAIGDILWPATDAGPTKLPPQGIERHIAPLALVDVGAGGAPSVTKDVRNVFGPIAKPAP